MSDDYYLYSEKESQSKSKSESQSESQDYDDELQLWINDCYINKYDIIEILDKLEQTKNLKNKVKYLSPIHQQFDSYYYLIETLAFDFVKYEEVFQYLLMILKSQSFENQISERCHLLITQTTSIDNLENEIQKLFQIFYYLKDIDMNTLKLSNISQIFTLQKIIEINYSDYQFNELFEEFDQFLENIQESAKMYQYKQTPAYPIPLEFIQFKNQNKQIFGQLQQFESLDVPLERYLDYHFNILREDYIYDMRKSISYLSEKGFYQHIDKNYTNNIGLYQNIKLESQEMDNNGILWKISLEQFNLDGRKQKNIDWFRSKKLNRGSLICITNVECHPLLFGVITDRSNKQNHYNEFKRIHLVFKFLGNKSYIMEFLNLLYQKTIVIENQILIESQIEYLESIKMIQSLPFENVLLKNMNYVSYPKYLKNKNVFQIDLDLKPLYQGVGINLWIQNWPYMNSTLDDSQLKAIKLILSQEVALIQGPPGTGKTYCGILAVRILYENLLSSDMPIIVVCYTNHALDQFLEHILKYIPIEQIARLGGRSKSPQLQQCLFQCKQKIRFNWNYFYGLKSELRKLFNKLISYEYSLQVKDIRQYWPQLYDKLIEKFLDDNDLNNSQVDSLAEDSILDCWIKGKLPNDSMLCTQTNLFGINNYYTREDITDQVFTNTIIERDKIEFDEDYYENESNEDIDEFLDSEHEYEQDDYGYRDQELQFEERQNDVILQNEQEQELNEQDQNEQNQNEQDQNEQDQNDQQHIVQSSQEVSESSDEQSQEQFNYESSQWQPQQQELNEFDIFNSNHQNQDNLHYNFQGIEKIQQYLQNENLNPWELNNNDRDEIIKYLEYLKYQEDCLIFQQKYKEFKQMSKTLKDLYEEKDILFLNQYKIIGATVNGAAKHINKLKKLNSKVLVIEEAAEVLESHIVAILTKNIQHLILIGDHLQLRPQLKCYELEQTYEANISLFERLYKNNIPSVTLSSQRRMKTKFADFIRIIYGNQYLDHENIYHNRNNMEIIGLSQDLVFFNHNWLEKDDSKSKENPKEAEMIFQMVQYLVKVGYQESQISVLSLYLRQAQVLKRKFMTKHLSQVKVQTVDNYQGEENDIVIISLVRNNNINKLGFIKVENRINVALSRARLGLYVFGCFDFIKKASNTGSLWRKIIALAQNKNYLQDFITLKCLTHNTLRKVEKSNEWFKLDAGCCQMTCNEQFDECNHICQSQCHLGNHTRDKCPEECERTLNCGHKCNLKCKDQCICTEKIKTILPDCNHESLILCGKDPSKEYCLKDLEIYFQECNHTVFYKCYERKNFIYKCQHTCQKQLQCGHSCSKKCWQICYSYPCEDECIKARPCGHSAKCQNMCSEECTPCDQKILIKLDCGKHEIVKKCIQIQNYLIQDLKISPCQIRSIVEQKDYNCEFQDSICYSCLSQIIKKLTEGCQDVLKYFKQIKEFNCQQPCLKSRECGHIFQCQNLCSEICTPCEKMVVKTLECGHEYQFLCKDKLDYQQNFKCKKQCIREYQCNHQQKCDRLCFEKCPPCKEKVVKQLECGHSIKTQCFQNKKCQKVCKKQRQCGHNTPCYNQCGDECSPCPQKIQKTFECGHQMNIQCFQTFIGCQNPCEKIRSCGHYFKCLNYCSQPCSPCQIEVLHKLSCNHQNLIKCYTLDNEGHIKQEYQQKCEVCQL
ncbi:unnamed protein product [Paramecium sonneborni]|uniref:P-loop containing nucleoside triphosphate hydrolase n=1 Tax=Paramecium sonneborni TaxID=65129 RepID=A0A8S1LKN2_9CILI|nr:unnamed protein product [Paramecium sonneborni]